MKKILIKGYFQRNLGDDLFVKILCERYPEHQFYLQCDDENYTSFQSINNLQQIPVIKKIDGLFKKVGLQWSINHHRFLKMCTKVDAVVNIGGSIFIQNKNWQQQVKAYQKEINANSNYYMIGCNFGPYYSQDFYDAYIQLFQKVKDVCFRDDYSYQLFKQIPSVRLASDIVLTYPCLLTKETDSIVFSIIDLSQRNSLANFEEAYLHKMHQLVEWCVNKNKQVILMSFCGIQNDLQAIEKLMNRIDDKTKQSIQVINYQGDLEKALTILASCQAIVATRFHAIILGFLLKKKVIPIIYSEKSTNILKDLQYQGSIYPIESIESMNLEHVWCTIENEPVLSIEKAIINAEKQFEKLDHFLEDVD